MSNTFTLECTRCHKKEEYEYGFDTPEKKRYWLWGREFVIEGAGHPQHILCPECRKLWENKFDGFVTDFLNGKV